MCGEMLKDPTAPEVRLYAKTLSNLELSREETVRKDLQTLLQQLVQVLKYRQSCCRSTSLVRIRPDAELTYEKACTKTQTEVF